MECIEAIALCFDIIQFIDACRTFCRAPATDITAKDEIEKTVTPFLRKLSVRVTCLGEEDGTKLCPLEPECQAIFAKIREADDPEAFKVPGLNSWARHPRTLFKSRKSRRRDAMLQLAGMLDACQDQLDTWLKGLKRSYWEAKIQSSMQDATKLERVLGHLKNFQVDLAHTSLERKSEDTQFLIKHLVEEILQEVIQRSPMSRVSPVELYRREEEIITAHPRTFQWIFGDESSSMRQSHPLLHFDRFVDWLRCGNGIFHISGKAGSGKSTLMKFLSQHHRTQQELAKWAVDKTLVISSVFFWNTGTSFQRSLDGLLITLIHSILSQCPELISEVFPGPYNRQWQERADLPTEEALAAFSRMLKAKCLFRNRCVFIFIDGLDEFDQTLGLNHFDLVSMLHSWVSSASPLLKICVSSREYNVFVKAFDRSQRMRLQDLTRDDIANFVRDKLHNRLNTEASTNIDDLVEIVVNCADGVFLWASLVTRHLREMLDHGSTLQDLKKALRSLPLDLEGLFPYLIEKSSHPPSRREMRPYLVFGIMRTLAPYDLELSLLSCSFLSNYEEDKEFALHISGTGMSDSERKELLDRTRRSLYHSCAGLVETVHQGKDNEVVRFIHRSIVHYIEQTAMSLSKELVPNNMDITEAISQLFLAELKTMSHVQVDEPLLSFWVYALIDMRMKRMTDHPPFLFQESIQSVILQHRKTALSAPVDARLMTTRNVGSDIASYDSDYVTTPLHVSAFLGDYEYIRWKLDQDPSFLDSHSSTVCLLDCIETGTFYANHPEALRLLELLLARRISPQMVFPRASLVAMGETDAKLSLWQRLIILAVFVGRLERGSRLHRVFGEVVQTMLEHGADPHLQISVVRELHCQEYSAEAVISME